VSIDGNSILCYYDGYGEYLDLATSLRTNIVTGTTYLVIAQVIFLVSGFVIHFVLGGYFGPETYGIYGVVLTLMTTVNLLLTGGFPQGASRYISMDTANVRSIIRQANKIQIIFAVLVFAAYFGLADVLSRLLKDEDIASFIRFSAIVVPAFALFYMYNNGYLNGLHRFGKQAKVLIVSSLAKVGFVFLFVFLGMGVKGAIGGYFAAAVIGLIIAWRYLGKLDGQIARFDWRKLIRFGVPATLIALVLFLLMNIDLFAVKAIVRNNADVGYYTAATTIARIPYFLSYALALTLLPAVSQAVSMNNTELVQDHIRKSFRYMLMILIPLTLLMSSTSGEIVSLVYSSSFAPAQSLLSVLIFGLGLLSIFLILINIIMGAGKQQLALGIALLLVPADIGLNLWLVPAHGLLGAAYATTITALTGVIVAVSYVLYRFKALIGVGHLLKICGASAVTFIVLFYITIPALFLVPVCIGLVILYLGILVLLKVINRKDLDALKRMFMGSRLNEHNE